MNRRTLFKTLLGTITALATFKVTANEPSDNDGFFEAIKEDKLTPSDFGLSVKECQMLIARLLGEHEDISKLRFDFVTFELWAEQETGIFYGDYVYNVKYSISEEEAPYGVIKEIVVRDVVKFHKSNIA
jgi:hypothetical protein